MISWCKNYWPSALQNDLKSAYDLIAAKDKKLAKLQRRLLQEQRQKNAMKSKLKAVKVQQSKVTKVQKDKILSDALAPFFTNAQVSCFQRGSWQRVRTWGKEDLKLALTLRMLSSRTFEYLRSIHYPLPARSTLEGYFKSFQVAPGFLDCVGELIQFRLPTMSKTDKVCSINFDEMHLSKAIGNRIILVFYCLVGNIGDYFCFRI